MNEEVRVGIGYDIHRLADGRRLVLGGVAIDFPRGLVGHSDADVVLHAVTDALLGAAGLPDIGELFPDTDPAYRDADSRALLGRVMPMIQAKGFRPGNIDIIVHADVPKLSPYKPRMAESIAALTGIEADRVSVKAKTNEGMGPLGHADAIACTAIASVWRLQSTIGNRQSTMV
jgi:2-C-methyl-D-erythritol 2,4-cyclodiphosphate synthase